jgi:acetyl esterase/lipase
MRLGPAIVATLALLLVATPAQADEIIEPPNGKQPQGVMIVIHGGAWLLTGDGAVASARPQARRYAKLGWRVHNIDHEPGLESYGSVVKKYDELERTYRKSRLPICAYGISSGGHLALLLAQARASLDCVIADAAPTDLVNYNGGTEEVPVKTIIDTYLKPYFDLVAWSPAYSGARMRQPAILNYAENDPIVPVTQADALRATANTATTELNCLPAGTVAFVHSGVDHTHLGRARAEERKLLRQLARR